jgi:anti-sigma factor RsiW
LHARHDRFAIADAVGGGALPSTLRTCPACGALHADLISLQRAVREAWVPRRTRDLRLTLRDATRLRRRRLRRLVDRIGTQRDAITRPLALSFTGLGLAGLMLSTVPSVLPSGSAGAAPVELGRAPASTIWPVTSPPSDAAGSAMVAAHVPDTTEPASSLPGLSMGMLGIGTAIFIVRRLANRPERVR